MSENAEDLRRIYERRFAETAAYRNEVWKVLTRDFFQKYAEPTSTVLDLGCGYGEFINNIRAGRKLAMDLNPDAPKHLGAGVEFLRQDCSKRWPFADNTLDLVFTSNFFEHLPDKQCLKETLREAHRCLKRGGRLIALGPNIKYLPGLYWDFFDHHTILTELSLGEVLEVEGFRLEKVVGRFLPYTIVQAFRFPIWVVSLYLKLPFLWWIRGRQFLVVAVKP
jgi:SAM-dependent methyltransferase